MENILETAVKKNGNIDFNELSWKQIFALLWFLDILARHKSIVK